MPHLHAEAVFFVMRKVPADNETLRFFFAGMEGEGDDPARTAAPERWAVNWGCGLMNSFQKACIFSGLSEPPRRLVGAESKAASATPSGPRIDSVVVRLPALSSRHSVPRGFTRDKARLTLHRSARTIFEVPGETDGRYGRVGHMMGNVRAKSLHRNLDGTSIDQIIVQAGKGKPTLVLRPGHTRQAK